MRVRKVRLTALLSLAVVALLAPVPARAAAAEVVTIKDGQVRGRAGSDVREFFDIPYAAPPTGGLRFKPPQPPQPWRGVRDARRAGDICPQATPLGTRDEDCLRLNVSTPARTASNRLPVIVWIHGGAYTLGSGAGYDPKPLVTKGGVVAVSFNYRLGPLGFLALPELAEESATTGNYAIQDQQAALRWVRDNIAAFGGDPGNVTIFGESAGGHSVCMHLQSEGSKGLFHKAISNSGGCGETNLGPRTLADGFETGEKFAKAAGCAEAATRLECLRGKTADELIDAMGDELLGDDLGFIPTIDGKVIKEPTFAAIRSGRYNQVPLLLGSNKDEGTLFVAVRFHLTLKRSTAEDLDAELGNAARGEPSREQRAAYRPEARDNADVALAKVITDTYFACPALFTARAGAARPGQKVFQYQFADPEPPYSRLDPFMPLGDFHASELMYLFAAVQGAPPVGLSDARKKLADQMIGYWTTFARNGDPNGGGSPAWPAFTSNAQRAMKLTSEGSAPTTSFANDHQCGLWD